jgi:hypothetical protein
LIDRPISIAKSGANQIAAISVARKLTRRCYHILRDIDPDQVYAISD